MSIFQWLTNTRPRQLAIFLAFAVTLGGACNCDDDDDPTDDVGIDDVDDDDVDEDDDVDDDDVDEDPVDIPEGMARIQVIHDAADPGAEMVDVYFDEELVIDDFNYRMATPYIDVDAATYEIGVAEDDSESSDDAVATFSDVEFAEGERYVVVASGVLTPGDFEPNPDEGDTEFALYVLDNAMEVSEEADRDSIVFFHGVTDAPSVEIFANNETTLVEELAYSGFSDGYASLPQGITVFDILASETDEPINSYQTPPLDGGEAYVAVASGFLDTNQNEDAPFDILVYPTPVDGDRVEPIVLDEAARLQLIHNSIDPDLSPADLFVGGELLAEDVEYQDATPFLTFPHGESVDVAITEPGADVGDAVLEESFEFASGDRTIAIASGVLDPTAYPENPEDIETEFTVYTNENAQDTGVELGMVNMLGFHGILDAPESVVIVEADGDEITLVQDLGYGEFGDYETVPLDDAATLYFSTNDPPPLPDDGFEINLEGFNGESVVAVVSGILDAETSPPVTAFVVTGDGESYPLTSTE